MSGVCFCQEVDLSGMLQRIHSWKPLVVWDKLWIFTRWFLLYRKGKKQNPLPLTSGHNLAWWCFEEALVTTGWRDGVMMPSGCKYLMGQVLDPGSDIAETVGVGPGSVLTEPQQSFLWYMHRVTDFVLYLDECQVGYSFFFSLSFCLFWGHSRGIWRFPG